MKLNKLLFASTFMLFAAVVLALLANPVAAKNSDKVQICHVQPKPNQTEPDASGRVIEISRDACEDHCIDHGGDHVIGDGACAFAFPGQDTCVVNSLNPEFCSIERCIGICANECGDCLATHGPGCEPDSCESAVCAIDPFCCEFFWDGLCVHEALEICVPNGLCEE